MIKNKKSLHILMFLLGSIYLSMITACGGSSSSDSSNSAEDDLVDEGSINDEFNAPFNFESTTSNTWNLHRFDGTSRTDSIDASQTKPGWLVMLPTIPPPGTNLGWFGDTYSAYLYQEVSGNFVVATKLRVVSRNNINVQPPSTDFNAGGLVIRDSAGTHNGNENWVMYNIGAQTSGTPSNYSREIKKTVNSASNMFLTDQDDIEEHLLVCRVDENFYFYYWDDVINNWREETFYNNADLNGSLISTRIANNTSITPEIANILPSDGNTSPISFRFDAANNFFMPNTLQVGLIAHNWSNTGDTRAEFDYVRFATNIPATKNDCLTEFAGLGSQ
ncbi:hypothetical protein MNBD_GAMMA05-2475 [hydrothermal vent metagenome]|uniref:Uncharacterized protein n=1 Tax=hydrothermal vent metagenome TaxID=652676 RepID=A0A3B0WJD5_9ZZZZ